jgi:hypothetical protein
MVIALVSLDKKGDPAGSPFFDDQSSTKLQKANRLSQWLVCAETDWNF